MKSKGVISQSQCETVMRNFLDCAKECFEIRSFSVSPMAQREGLSGEHFILKIQYSKCGGLHEVDFFVKILFESIPPLYAISREILAYEKEAFFYETLVPLMEQQGLDCNYAPRSFLCEPYTVVLEHLANSSYTCFGKNKPLDYRHCIALMETVARFHFAAILFEKVRSRKGGKKYDILEEFPILKKTIFTNDVPQAAKYMRFTIQAICGVIDVIPEDGVSRNTFKKKLIEALDEILSSHIPQGMRSMIIHADLWSNNFLFSYGDNDEIKDCKLIDFQVMHYGPPSADLLYFIFCNTRKEFRQKHQQDIFTHYYNHLSLLSSDKGISPAEVFSESEFWKSLHKTRVPAKLHAMVNRCATSISEKQFRQALQTDFSRFLFEDRGKYILQAFEENSVFREIFTEDIGELKDMLFPS